MTRFSIIIVSWNALPHLKTYLPTVAATEYPNFEIILADNASTDGSAEWTAKHFPEVKIVSLEENYGYCGGNNRAVPYADGDILVFLNNDVRVDPDWLKALDQCFKEHPQVGALQPKMLSDERPEYFEYAGAAGGFLDKYGYPFCRGRIFETVEKDEGQYDTASDIFWASGAALAIRRDVFVDLKGFDEDFEFHMEEIDLCWRLWNNGYKVRFCPQSTVYHLGGGSMPMGSPRKVYYNYRNNLRMLWKNSSTSTLFRRFTIRYILDVIAAFRSIGTGNLAEFKAIFRAHRHFWGTFGETENKRQYLQGLRKDKSDPHTLLPVNLIREYFIKSRHTYRKIIKHWL